MNFAPSEDNQEDPNSPFGNSSGSNGHSEAESSTVAFPTPSSALYQLVRLTGWTPDQIDAAPVALCDWLLAIDGARNKAEAEDERERLAREPGVLSLQTGEGRCSRLNRAAQSSFSAHAESRCGAEDHQRTRGRSDSQTMTDVCVVTRPEGAVMA